jgi:hypothetical protein
MQTMSKGSTVRLTAEALAYWYFRLNGCLQIENFVIHPDPDWDPSQNQARTEADLIGVRMPWRTEKGMVDDGVVFKKQHDKILVYFAEIKAGKTCTINGPWSNPTLQNIPRALRAIGCIPDDRVDNAAKQLYETCFYEDALVVVRLMAVGRKLNAIYQHTKPEVVQITWHHVLTFIHGRFHDLRVSKKEHSGWPTSGRLLWEMSEANAENFERKVLAGF